MEKKYWLKHIEDSKDPPEVVYMTEDEVDNEYEEAKLRNLRIHYFEISQRQRC
jgi:hypothetical protein